MATPGPLADHDETRGVDSTHDAGFFLETDWSGDRGGHDARVAGRDRPQNPGHTEWAPMRGTQGGVGGRRTVGLGCGTVSGHCHWS